MLLVCAATFLLAGCAAPTPSAQTVRGILLDVQGASLQRFESFTLRTDDGRELRFEQADDFNVNAAHPMTPGHMRQHMALAEPVTVTYRAQGERLLAVQVGD